MRRPAAFFPITLTLGVILVAEPDAQAAPTAITACQTINQPGSYVLANNLTASGNCLTITVNFVTIDLAGFSISGPGGIGANGILAVAPSPTTPLRGIAVRNGSISNFDNGVDIGVAGGSIVEGLRVFGSTHQGINANGVVKGNTVENNREFGILAGGIVTENYATGNDIGIAINTGILSWNTAGAQLEGNRIGMLAISATLIGNTAAFNTDVGISVDCPANLTDNTAINNPTNLSLNGTDCHNEDNVAP